MCTAPADGALACDSRKMSGERGVSPLIAVAIVGFATVGIGVFSYYLFSSKEAIDANRKASAEAMEAPEEIAADSPMTQSLISYDSFVYSSPVGMYYQDSSGGSSNETGSKPVKYVLIPNADPATFSEIKKTSVPSPGSASADAQTVVTYYRDSDQVFVAQTTAQESGTTQSSVSTVVTADPATFQILNDTYAKDANNVYIVSWVCQGETCTLELVIVVGADPATFHVIEETIVQTSDGSGTVTADAVDGTHLFNDGVIVDTVVTPGSDETDMTPILISP